MQKLTSVQGVVFDNIERRGYTKGYRDMATLLKRQVCKLIEELAEVEEHTPLPEQVSGGLQDLGQAARRLFDDKRQWDFISEITPEQVAGLEKELADMQVVLFVAAECLARIKGTGPYGERYSVLAAAFNKSIGDIKRGVR